MGTVRQSLPSFVTGRRGLGTWRQPFLRKNGREAKGAKTTANLRYRDLYDSEGAADSYRSFLLCNTPQHKGDSWGG